jgi:anti-sigma factor RsiW
MDCKDTPNLVHGYIDGETDLQQSLAFEAHVQGCAACRGLLEEQQELRQLIRTQGTYHPAPEGLAARIRDAIDAPAKPKIARARFAGWQPLAMAASLALAVLASSGTTYYVTAPGAQSQITDEVIADHLRSLMANHLTDVASSDQHTVKPWFDGRIDLAPPVKDLTAEGYPLVGGRLDYLGDQPAAALVYRHRKHIINVFIARATAEVQPSTATRHGYHVLRWAKDGMAYWAVSDVDPEDLQELHRLIEAP